MKRRITLDCDEALLGAIDRQAGRVGESRARFIVGAVEGRLSSLERQRLDAEFEAMSRDAQRSAETRAIERELAPATDAAWSRIDSGKPPARPRRSRKGSRAAR